MIIIITLYFQAQLCIYYTFFSYILPFMFFIFVMQEEWTWNISNYIIKSDVCIKLQYIQISLDIYHDISYRAESKKEEINIIYENTKCLTSGSI